MSTTSDDTANLNAILERITSTNNAQVLVIGHSFSNLEGFLKDMQHELEQRCIPHRVLPHGHSYNASNVAPLSGGSQRVVISSFLHSPPRHYKGRRLVLFDNAVSADPSSSSPTPTGSRILLLNTDTLSDAHQQTLLDQLVTPQPDATAPLVISLHQRRTISPSHGDNLVVATQLLGTRGFSEKWPRVMSSLVVPWLTPGKETAVRDNMKSLLTSMSVSMSPGAPWHQFRPMFVERREICGVTTATWVCTLTSQPSNIDSMFYRTQSMLNAHFSGNYSFFPAQAVEEGSEPVRYILRYLRPHRQAFDTASQQEVLIEALKSVGWSVRRPAESGEWLPCVPPVTPHVTLRVGSRVWNRQNHQLGTVVRFKSTDAIKGIKGLENTQWPVVCYDAAQDQKKPESDIEIPSELTLHSRLSWIEETSMSLPVRFCGALTARELVASDGSCAVGVVGQLPPVAVRLGAFQRSPQLLMLSLRYAKRPLLVHEVFSAEWMGRCVAQLHSRWYHNATRFLVKA